jgi:hypothetical protein
MTKKEDKERVKLIGKMMTGKKSPKKSTTD